MQPAAAARLVRGETYTRTQIRLALGGSARAALPTVDGRVVCACLTREANPRAPAEIVVGAAEEAVRRARIFASSGHAVPVFVRSRPGAWEHAGRWRVRLLVDDTGEQSLVPQPGAAAGGAVLFMEESG